VVVFHLVQDATTITGDGRWSVGKTEWSRTGGRGLKAGSAQAIALADLGITRDAKRRVTARATVRLGSSARA